MNGNGVWFKKPRPEPVHYCSTPNHETDVLVGDRWQCGSCGQVWEVIAIDLNRDRFLKWKKVYAPGVHNDTREDPYDPNRLKCR